MTTKLEPFGLDKLNALERFVWNVKCGNDRAICLSHIRGLEKQLETLRKVRYAYEEEIGWA